MTHPDQQPAARPVVTASAPAKTNLSLHVGSPTPDGYHPLETLFLALDLRETVTATLEPALARRGNGITVSVAAEAGSAYERMVEDGSARLSDIPLDGSNLVVRAALAVCEALAVPVPGIALSISKAVPVAGGMGGGSADAAAALLAVNHLVAEHAGVAPLSGQDLHRIAATLGADVPFMLLGGAAIGRGTGTELESVPAPAPLHLVVVPQDQGLSTPAVYRQWDEAHTVVNAEAAPHGGAPTRSGVVPDPVPADVLEALAAGDVDELAARVRNDLQAPAIRLLPELETLLDHGVELGAVMGWVSGSGPTVCFLVRSADAARRLVADFDREQRRAIAVTGPATGAGITSHE
ncbi:4-(cytidine 5'-diphospho)-2-C-methyl-D-erythritol kinase [Kocuria varians]|uniref:4-(cytidine 5'-diphospho)-2-C-methyl-D-erythritol kinase n=1 Tax=Kocuria varians TaxID=1272 RepID=UPI0008395322|nr:4-(cytidine 5'-diphospho)-2-C-methyl-D-erythritol kinase [Kocuria varians]